MLLNPMCIQIGISLGCSLHLPDTWLTQGVEGTMVKSTMGAKSQVDRDRQSAFLLEILEFDWKFWYFLKGVPISQTIVMNQIFLKAVEKQQKVIFLDPTSF